MSGGDDVYDVCMSEMIVRYHGYIRVGVYIDVHVCVNVLVSFVVVDLVH